MGESEGKQEIRGHLPIKTPNEGGCLGNLTLFGNTAGKRNLAGG